MVFNLIPELQIRQHHFEICVRVIRKWEYRGQTDNGPVQHVDLVLADEKGNAIYGEIPQNQIARHDSKIQENGIYAIKRFKVTNPRPSSRPVHTPYMIEFTCYTEIKNVSNPPTTFPRYVYKLTEFNDLYTRVGEKTFFLDVLAVITEVAEPEWRHISTQEAPALIRNVMLQNTSGDQLRLTLWGRRATEFNIDTVYNPNDPKPIITLFVGCLMKTFMKEHYLSGNAACKWYFNPDIPEAVTLHNSLQGQHIEIKRTGVPLQEPTQITKPPSLEPKNLQELDAIHPYEFPKNGYNCTVTIARLMPNTSWWFPSCNLCNRSCAPEGSGYKCRECNCTGYTYKLKLGFIATDGTAEAEMICFGSVAGRIVRKSVEYIMQSMRRGATIPPDISAIVSHKYTFTVTLTNDSYHTEKRTYLIKSVITDYGKQRIIPQLGGSSSVYCSQPISTTPYLSSPIMSSPPYTQPSITVSAAETPTKDAPPLDFETPEKSSTLKRLCTDEAATTQENSPKKSKAHEDPSQKETDTPYNSSPDRSPHDDQKILAAKIDASGSYHKDHKTKS